ncbi:hypothetical protein SAMN04490200_4426 [Pseudomonas proteolytica]|nr:hypothetical protein SAMN04490200_4426 [Pseudomonas proteolytica]
MTRHWFFCGERACPALGGKAAPTPSPSSTRYTEGNGFGSAAQPSGGQAPLPQRAMQQPGTRCQHWLFCGERACPALGGEAAPTPSPSSTRYTEGNGFGSAAQPSGGQAPLPQRAMQQPGTRCQHWLFCGERACPALGGKAAPTPSPSSTRYTELAGFGSATQPSGGQAPLPQRALQQPATCCPTLAFLVASGLAPRWAAKPPQ